MIDSLVIKQPTALVFGESDNDRSAIVELVLSVRSELSALKFTKLRDPPVYLRQEQLPATRQKSAQAIAALVAAQNVINNVRFVMTQQDCDNIELAHELASSIAATELENAGVRSFIIATPAFELESWWMLFPSVLKKVESLWRQVDDGTANVGEIAHSKERLIVDLRPLDPKTRSRCRDDNESMSVSIARMIRETGAATRPTTARSSSFEAFKRSIQAISL